MAAAIGVGQRQSDDFTGSCDMEDIRGRGGGGEFGKKTRMKGDGKKPNYLRIENPMLLVLKYHRRRKRVGKS